MLYRQGIRPVLVVSDPGNLAQGIINTTKQIVQTSTTAKNTLDGFMEAQKIFQQGKKYYDALKAVHDVVKGGVKVERSPLNWWRKSPKSTCAISKTCWRTRISRLTNFPQYRSAMPN